MASEPHPHVDRPPLRSSTSSPAMRCALQELKLLKTAALADDLDQRDRIELRGRRSSALSPVRRSRPRAIGGYVMTSPARCTYSMLSVAAWCDTIINWGGCVTTGVRRPRLVRVGGTRHQPLFRTLFTVSVHSPAPSTGNPPLAGRGRVTARAGPLAAKEPSLCRELLSARSAPNEITEARSVARCSGHGRGLRVQ